MPPAGATAKCRLICLTGFMGCGKSTIGRQLARQLAWRFVDLDTRIEEHASLSITEIFNRWGEPAFRKIEHEQLLRALSEAAAQAVPAVLALGGGTFAQPQNMESLRSFGVPAASAAAQGPAGSTRACVVLWLDCPMDVLLARCATMADRPLFRDETAFRQLYAERLPFYQRADYRIEGHAEPRRVVEQILTLGFLDPSVGVREVWEAPRKNSGGRANV